MIAPQTPPIASSGEDLRPRVHHIKCWPGVFEEMQAGRKVAEFRRNDRDYETGDDLLIREWCPEAAAYTHREISATITHVLSAGFGMPAGYAMLSLAFTAEGAEVQRSPINAGNIVYRGEEWVPLSAYCEAMAGWKAANAAALTPPAASSGQDLHPAKIRQARKVIAETTGAYVTDKMAEQILTLLSAPAVQPGGDLVVAVPVPNRPAEAEDHPLLKPVLDLRKRAAADFSEPFSGQRGQDFDRGLMAAFECVNGTLQKLAPATPQPEAEEGA